MKKLNRAIKLFSKFAMGPEGPKCQICGDRYEYADPDDPYCYKHCDLKNKKEEESKETKRTPPSNKDWLKQVNTLYPSKKFPGAFTYTFHLINGIMVKIMGGDKGIHCEPLISSSNLNDYTSVLVEIKFGTHAASERFMNKIRDFESFDYDYCNPQANGSVLLYYYFVKDLNELLNELRAV